MKIINMRKGDWNNVKAFFSVETEEGIEIRGFKLVDGRNGLFVSAPSKKSEKDSKWYDEVRMPEELRDKLQEEALKEYGGGDTQQNLPTHPF